MRRGFTALLFSWASRRGDLPRPLAICALACFVVTPILLRAATVQTNNTFVAWWWVVPVAAALAFGAYFFGRNIGNRDERESSQANAGSAPLTASSKHQPRPPAQPLVHNNVPRRSFSRLYAPAALDFWWVRVPTRLRRYSVTFSSAWADGLYLTAWPRLAVFLAIFAASVGLALGASHWSPYVIGEYSMSTTGPITVFAESLPFLFVATILGSLSAHLGVMLTLGYIIGDYLIAGPATASWGYNSTWPLFFGERLPLLLCYWLLFMLAARTILTSNALAASLLRSLRGDESATKILRAGATAAFQFALVYAWAVATPMIIRIVWIWTGRGGSPFVVPDYLKVVAPWVPLAAAAMVVVRGFLMQHALRREAVIQRLRRIKALSRYADFAPAFTRRMPLWARALIAAAAMTFLISGLLLSFQYAAAMFLLFAVTLLVRALLLPKLQLWNAWARTAARVPLGARLAAAALLVFLISRFVVAIPGRLDSQGKFGIELICLAIGLPIMLLLAANGEGAGSSNDSHTNRVAASTVKFQNVTKVAGTAVLLLCVFSANKAYANCLDDSCCFADFLGAALVITAVVILAMVFVAPLLDLFLAMAMDGLFGTELTADVLAMIGNRAVRIAAAGVLGGAISGIAEYGGSLGEPERSKGDDSIEEDGIVQGVVGGVAGGAVATAVEGGVNVAAEGVGHALADGPEVVNAVVNTVGGDTLKNQRDFDSAQQAVRDAQQQNATRDANHSPPSQSDLDAAQQALQRAQQDREDLQRLENEIHDAEQAQHN